VPEHPIGPQVDGQQTSETDNCLPLQSGRTTTDDTLRLMLLFMIPLCVGGVAILEVAHGLDDTPPALNKTDRYSAIGWGSAFVAILGYGCSNLCMKFLILEEVPPQARIMLFNAWGAVGHAVFAAILCVTLRASEHGGVGISLSAGAIALSGVGAVVIVVTQAMAVIVVPRLGVAVASTIWANIGMTVAFLWGVVYFRESIYHPVWGAVGVALLGASLGIATLAITFLQECRSEADSTLDAIEAQRSYGSADAHGIQGAQPGMRVKRHRGQMAFSLDHLAGLVLAMTVGLIDGSMLVPLKFFYQSVEIDALPHNYVKYLYTFVEFERLFLLAIGVLLFISHFLWTILHRGTAGLHEWVVLISKTALPGFMAGALLAAGNTGAIHAMEYLGLAIGFPLTQMFLLITVGCGTLFFRELRSWEQRATIIVAAFVSVCGAIALGVSGRD